MPSSLLDLLPTIAASLAALILGAGFFYLWYKKRQQFRRQEALETTFFRVLVPKGNEVEIEAAEHLYNALYSLKNLGKTGFWGDLPAISFEIVAQNESIDFYLAVPNRAAHFVEKQIHSAYPDAQIEWTQPYNIWQGQGQVSSARLKLSGEEFYPINVEGTTGEKASDPLSSITSAMSKLEKGEALVLQMLVRPASNRWQTTGQGFVSKVKYAKSVSTEEGGKSNKKYKYVDDKFLDGISDKCKKVGFDVCIRLVSVAKTYPESWANLVNLANAFEQFTDPRFSSFKRQQAGLKKLFMWNFMYRLFPLFGVTIPVVEKPFLKKTSVLNALEMATICHFPNKNVSTPHMNWVTARTAAPPAN